MLQAPSPLEQQLLALRFAARLSSGEIAVLIGKSEAATKKQLTRLLHHMQEHYRREVLDELLPDLLEPTLPAFLVALRQVYAVPLPDGSLGEACEEPLKLVAVISW